MPAKKKIGKVNCFEEYDSYESSSDDESEGVNQVEQSESSSENDICEDPHCPECHDECACSDPDICRCNSVHMMKNDNDETSRTLFTQMMSATDPQIRDMYKKLLT